jgi:hypothetical protein
MAESLHNGARRRAGVPLPLGSAPPRIPVIVFGLSLGILFTVTYALCVLFYLLFPDMVLNHAVLALFLPGFKLLTWPSFLLGLVESFVYAWYVALIFVPLFNYFAARFR